jgi:hypothetical protein
LAITVVQVECGVLTVPFKPAEATTAEGIDIYMMDAGKESFDWLRSYEQENAGGTEIKLSKKGKGNFEVYWFESWNGEWIKTEKNKVKNGKLILKAPKTETAQPDIAFKIRKN